MDGRRTRWILSLLALLTALGASMALLERLRDGPDALPQPASSPQTTPQPARSGAATAPVDASAPIIVYRWRDARGTIHYESRPPADGVYAEVIEIRARDVAPEEVMAPEQVAGRQPPGAPTPDRGPLSVYSTQGMEELMERLDGTLRGLDERARTMRELEKDL
jgi:hypothetical protein